MIPSQDLNESYTLPSDSLQSNDYTTNHTPPLDLIETRKLQSQPITDSQCDNIKSPLSATPNISYPTAVLHKSLPLHHTSIGPTKSTCSNLGTNWASSFNLPKLNVKSILEVKNAFGPDDNVSRPIQTRNKPIWDGWLWIKLVLFIFVIFSCFGPDSLVATH